MKISSGDPARILSVASFNVRWGVELNGGELDLAAVVSILDADLIALQEVWAPKRKDRSLCRIADTLGYRVAELALTDHAVREARAFVAEGHPNAGCWQLAILSRVGLENGRAIALGRAPGDPVARSALLVDVPVGNGVVSIANIHLSHQIFATPLQVWRVGRRLGREHEAIVLTGDFNCGAALVRALLPQFRPVVRGRTWPARRPLVQLDHVFVSGSIRPVRGAVLADLGSDHLPVRAELVLEARK